MFSQVENLPAFAGLRADGAAFAARHIGPTPDEQAAMLRSTFVGKSFEKDPAFTHFVWDVLVAAVIIDPSLITSEVTCRIDVNDAQGLSYGQSLAYPKTGPEGSQKARIVLDMDQKRFWDMLNDKQYWASVRKK